MYKRSEIFNTDDMGRTVLFHYAASGNKKEVDNIISRLNSSQCGALLRLKDKSGKTAADVAKECGHDEIATLMEVELGRIDFFG